jgi:uncharacterized Zn finger protein
MDSNGPKSRPLKQAADTVYYDCPSCGRRTLRILDDSSSGPVRTHCERCGRLATLQFNSLKRSPASDSND